MIELLLVGIGTGNPEHLTLQAIKALNSADLILIPRKGADKADLAELRRSICTEVVTNPTTRIVEFDLPRRDQNNPDYRGGVDDWHDAIAEVWSETIKSELHIAHGQTTDDNQFTLTEVECLGACANAPMVQINDDNYEDLTYESMTAILEALAKGETPKPGPQIERQTSCPEGGPTTLPEMVSENHDYRDQWS